MGPAHKPHGLPDQLTAPPAPTLNARRHHPDYTTPPLMPTRTCPHTRTRKALVPTRPHGTHTSSATPTPTPTPPWPYAHAAATPASTSMASPSTLPTTSLLLCSRCPMCAQAHALPNCPTCPQLAPNSLRLQGCHSRIHVDGQPLNVTHHQLAVVQPMPHVRPGPCAPKLPLLPPTCPQQLALARQPLTHPRRWPAPPRCPPPAHCRAAAPGSGSAPPPPASTAAAAPAARPAPAAG